MLPDNHVLEARYFERMKRGLGEKLRLLDHTVPGTSLNVGAGGPELSLALKEAGHRTLSLDASPDACSLLDAAGLLPILGSAEDMTELVDEPIHNIVFSSILHEVFSYAEDDRVQAVCEVLRSAFELLEPGGRVVIRDGVKALGTTGTLVTETAEMRCLATEYIASSPLVPSNVAVDRISDNEWSGSLPSVMEILNTINWGRGSLQREMNELFGVFTANEYVRELADVGFDPCEHQMCDKTYRKHLEGKAHVQDAQGRVLWTPPTAIWVGTKPLDKE